MDTFIDYYDLAKDGILAWDTVDSALFDFLDNGIPLDSEKIWGSISCILRRLAALDAFPNGSYAEHNGSRETRVNCYKDQLFG